MILTDGSIREAVASGALVIDPFSDELVQPASIDLHLGDQFRVFASHSLESIDPRKEQADLTKPVSISAGGEFVLHPREFVLGTTVQSVQLPDDLVGRLEGLSSLGRLGLLVHSTSGSIDPGFIGQLNLELTNAATLPIRLFPGMRIAQLSLMLGTQAAEHPYGSKASSGRYQHQAGPTPSRSYRDFTR